MSPQRRHRLPRLPPNPVRPALRGQGAIAQPAPRLGGFAAGRRSAPGAQQQVRRAREVAEPPCGLRLQRQRAAETAVVQGIAARRRGHRGVRSRCARFAAQQGGPGFQLRQIGAEGRRPRPRTGERGAGGVQPARIAAAGGDAPDQEGGAGRRLGVLRAASGNQQRRTPEYNAGYHLRAEAA